MAKKSVAKKSGTGEKKPKTAAQEALETTFILMGTLKRVQLMYLRVGELLVEVRDKKYYEALKYPDMESWAQDRLGLGRASLYNYLRIRDWVIQFHPEWLKPKAKGFIPDLSDVGALMWIEAELAKKSLTPERRKTLAALHEKGLAGKLRRSEVNKVRKPDNTVKSGLQQIISKLRLVRKRASALASMPPEVLALMDSAIQMLVQEKAINVAGLGAWKSADTEKWHQKYLA